MEEDLAVGDVGGRFTVGDHDDLAAAALVGQHPAGEHEGVLHVGAVDEVPRHLGELRRFQLAGHLGEADDPEEVAGELARDQGVERHRHLLGGEEVVAHRHRQRQVEHQHGGRAGQLLHLLDLEVLRPEADGRPRPLPTQGVADRLFDVQGERVAELVGLVLRGPFVADAGPFDLVAADPVLGQLGEQLREGPLPDAPQALGGQLVATVPGVDQAGLLEHLGQAGKLLEAVGGVVAEQLAGPVEVGLGQLRR